MNNQAPQLLLINRSLFKIILSFLFLHAFIYTQAANHMEDYNISWDRSSLDASESMPLGGGDIGCNVWVENGDLLMYIQRSGSFSDNGEYLKLGRVRLSFFPNPFVNSKSFNQTLRLQDGYITIDAKGDKESDYVQLKMKLWVDQFTHAVHIVADADQKITINANYESWRTENRLLLNEKRGRFGCFSFEGYPGEIVKYKDSIAYSNNKVLFYHRNGAKTLSPDVMLAQQGLDQYKDQIVNKNANLTFGGFMQGEQFKQGELSSGSYLGTPFRAWGLKSIQPAKHHQLSVVTHIEQTKHVKEWVNKIESKSKQAQLNKGEFNKNKDWWNKFWNRSWIVTDPLQSDTDSVAWQIGRNYQLMRYQLGCNLNGEFPTKFNGGNFTVDPVLTDSKKRDDPDWRAWGGDVFTAQNQRLLYWPMLKSGDADGLKSQFNLYEWGLKGAMLKVQEYFGHKGAIFCEYASASGLDFGAGWGWTNGVMRARGNEVPFGDPSVDGMSTYGTHVEKGVMANSSISYHWESQVEHAYMMLEYHRFTGANIDQYMPFIENALVFFDEHYQKREQMRNGRNLDENGMLVFFPSTSCESYRGAKNPADLLSGIHACLEALIEVETLNIPAAKKAYYTSYLKRLPRLFYGEIEGDKIILPAESYMKYQNVECPQFYPLFPFNRFDIKSSEISIFKNSWKHGKFAKDMVMSWHQDGIFFARMGMVDEAYDFNKRKLANAPRRFPTFWGPGHDWVPDHNWGGSGMIGLQEMLLQTIDNKIYVLPAWPKGKDVCFKLHAPHNTTVEVEYIGGVIKKMKVTPASRAKDVELLLN
jgi:hypothetical protein